MAAEENGSFLEVPICGYIEPRHIAIYKIETNHFRYLLVTRQR